MIFKTISSLQTKKIAKLLAQEILSVRFPRKSAFSPYGSALVLALSGDLGAGKTTFVQGFLRGAGIRKKITSPTFIIMKKFKIPNPKSQTNSKFNPPAGGQNYKYIYHFDCYRINKLEDILYTSIREILNNPQNIVLIEWPERIKKLLPKKIISIRLKYGRKENERELNLNLKSL